MKKKSFLLLLGVFFLTGCATNNSLYSWGNYESALYKYYKKPDSIEGYIQALEKAILKGESNSNVAPGLYAELGYIYLEQGDMAKAQEYFLKEKSVWPESTYIIDKLIASTSSSTSEGEDK